MGILLFVAFLTLMLWVGGRFVYYYNTADAKDPWGKIVEAAGDSATYFVAKAGIFVSAALGMIATAGDFLSASPDAKTAVNAWLTTYVTNPPIVAVAGIGVMLMIWWARSRTKGT